MNLSRSFLITFLSLSLVSVSFLSFSTQSISAQENNIALQRGFRTGYSDGYMSGYRDVIDNTAKSYNKHNEYARADRAFNKDYGALEDYRDGYQQGFEAGYDTGFEKRSFDATIPASLIKRGVVAVKTAVEPAIEAPVPEPIVVEPKVTETNVTETSVAETLPPPADTQVVPTTTTTIAAPVNQPAMAAKSENIRYLKVDENSVLIPTDTELIVELLDSINTEQSSVGDKFKARVISPYELSGAIIEGRISKIQKPGRIKRRSEVLLSFDRIILNDNRWSNFNAILVEVLPTKGDNVRRVDDEGTVEGRSSVKDDSIKGRRDNRNRFGHRRDCRRSGRRGSRCRSRRGFRSRRGSRRTRKNTFGSGKISSFASNRLTKHRLDSGFALTSAI